MVFFDVRLGILVSATYPLELKIREILGEFSITIIIPTYIVVFFHCCLVVGLPYQVSFIFGSFFPIRTPVLTTKTIIVTGIMILSSDNPYNFCLEFIGRLKEITKNYLILESIRNVDDVRDVVDEGKSGRYHHILKKVITEPPKVFLEEGESLEEIQKVATNYQQII